MADPTPEQLRRLLDARDAGLVEPASNPHWNDAYAGGKDRPEPGTRADYGGDARWSDARRKTGAPLERDRDPVFEVTDPASGERRSATHAEYRGAPPTSPGTRSDYGGLAEVTAPTYAPTADQIRRLREAYGGKAREERTEQRDPLDYVEEPGNDTPRREATLGSAAAPPRASGEDLRDPRRDWIERGRDEGEQAPANGTETTRGYPGGRRLERLERGASGTRGPIPLDKRDRADREKLRDADAGARDVLRRFRDEGASENAARALRLREAAGLPVDGYARPEPVSEAPPVRAVRGESGSSRVLGMTDDDRAAARSAQEGGDADPTASPRSLPAAVQTGGGGGGGNRPPPAPPAEESKIEGAAPDAAAAAGAAPQRVERSQPAAPTAGAAPPHGVDLSYWQSLSDDQQHALEQKLNKNTPFFRIPAAPEREQRATVKRENARGYDPELLREGEAIESNPGALTDATPRKAPGGTYEPKDFAKVFKDPAKALEAAKGGTSLATLIATEPLRAGADPKRAAAWAAANDAGNDKARRAFEAKAGSDLEDAQNHSKLLEERYGPQGQAGFQKANMRVEAQGHEETAAAEHQMAQIAADAAAAGERLRAKADAAQPGFWGGLLDSVRLHLGAFGAGLNGGPNRVLETMKFQNERQAQSLSDDVAIQKSIEVNRYEQIRHSLAEKLAMGGSDVLMNNIRALDGKVRLAQIDAEKQLSAAVRGTESTQSYVIPARAAGVGGGPLTLDQQIAVRGKMLDLEHRGVELGVKAVGARPKREDRDTPDLMINGNRVPINPGLPAPAVNRLYDQEGLLHQVQSNFDKLKARLETANAPLAPGDPAVSIYTIGISAPLSQLGGSGVPSKSEADAIDAGPGPRRDAALAAIQDRIDNAARSMANSAHSGR
jgi:hypothetical protein